MAELLVTCENHICEIVINRPGKANALNTAIRQGLFAAFEQAAQDPECRVVVLTGAGDRIFCAGADLAEMAEQGIQQPPPDFAPILGRNVFLDKPVIAAVNGLALAGGFLLAQMCDLIIASTNAGFAITEAKRGRGAPWAMPLTRLMPKRIVTELLVTGEPISAARACEVGFVNEVVAPEELMKRAREIASVIAANAPLTVRASLRMLRFADEMGLRAAESVADEIFKEVYASEDAQEGPRAFREKRMPVWKGR